MIKNEEDTMLLTSWEDYISKVNKKLNLYKKDILSPDEISQVKFVSLVIQKMVTYTPQQIAYIFDRTRTLPEELLEKVQIFETKLNSCLLEKTNFENQLIQLTEENKENSKKYEDQDFECNKLKEEIIHLNIKLQEAATVEKNHQSDHSVMDKFKKQVKEVYAPKFKIEDLSKKKKKEKEAQQQLIQDHLMEELKTTTVLLNETLEERATLQSSNTSLQNTVTILEKKLSTYTENIPELDSDDTCNLVPSVIDVVVKFIIEKRKSDYYSKLLHPQPRPDSPKEAHIEFHSSTSSSNLIKSISQSDVPSTDENKKSNPIAREPSQTSDNGNPFDDGNPF